jgi:DNA-binding protein H-NS
VPEWEYRKIDLNDRPRKTDDVDLLGDAGKEGWELVQITANDIAYLKRMVEDSSPTQETNVNGHHATVEGPPEVKAKYRDPATGETWSGRGRWRAGSTESRKRGKI